MTIREYKNSFDNLKVCYIGDGNNMAHSLMVGCLKVGMDFIIACPKEYSPLDEYIKYSEELSKENGTKFKLTTSPKEAAVDADIVITDVWASMGQEEEAKKRQEAFKGYTVDLDLMSIAKDDAIVLHCLPAHRDEEISSEVLDRYSPSIFDEAENRLHVQKAVLVKLMS